MSKWINETDLLVNIVKKSRYTSKTIGEAIDESQSIEVVRCKDCKYAEENWNGKDIYCLRTSSFPWSNDSFCSDGERKDGDPDD